MEQRVERRNSKRENFEGKVEIYPLFPSYSESLDRTPKGFFEAFARDLSWGGVCLQTSVVLKAGSFIKLQMELAGVKNVEMLGHITWVRDTLCGVAFTSLINN